MNLINKFIFSVFCFLFCFINTQSQNIQIDSLKNELLIHKKRDTIRVNLLNDLAYSYFRKDLDKAIAYIQESEVIAKAIGFKKGHAKSLYIKGVIQAVQSNFDEGFQYFNEAMQLYETIKFKRGVSKCYNGIGLLLSNKGNQKQAIEHYIKSIKIDVVIGNKKTISASLNNIGRAYANLGKYTEAITYYKKALNINKEEKNEKRMSHCFNNIGSIYNEQGNYYLALKYYNKSLSIDEKLRNTIGISTSLNNIGIIYKNLQNYDKAIASYKKALKIQKKSGNKKNTAEILNNLGLAYKGQKSYEGAHKYLKEALKISKEIKNKRYIATCLNNIAAIYLELKNNKAAYQYFEKAKKNNLEVENQLGLCNSYLGIAKVYANQKKYTKALISALQSKDISSKIGLLGYQRDVYELLSDIYENDKKYKKALASHKQFKKLNDSLFNKENIEKITQLEYEYKYKQELELASFREKKLTKTVKLTSQDLEKSQRKLLLGVIAFLGITLILGTLIFFLRLRNEKSKTQNIVIEQKLLRSQMTPHFIFNSLSVLQGMILNKEEKKSISYLSKFSKLLRIILENSREKTVFLSQELTAVENYLVLQNLENESYKYTVLVDDTIDIPLFKIPPMLIQPFVENAIEHAFGNQKEIKKIIIHLKYLDRNLICTITDNGIGINSQKENKNRYKKSLSTTITSERLKILSKDFKMKGSVIIEDRQKFNEQGTIITLVIPYKIESL